MTVLKTNLKSKTVLTMLLCSTVVLSACSSGDEGLVLGTRDDIVIMKNGVPVDGSVTKTAMLEDEGMVAPVVPASGNTKDIAMKKVEAAIKEEGKAINTTVVTDAPKIIPAKTVAVEEAQEVMKKIEAVVSEDQSITPPESMEPVKEMVITETKTKVKQEIKKSPVVETNPQRGTVSTDVVESKVMANDNASKESVLTNDILAPETPKTKILQPAAPEKLEKVDASKIIEGCTKKVLTPAKMEGGKVIEQPKLETRRVLCQQDLTPGMIAVVQKALMTRGYNIGAPDGKLGNKTFNAIESYQRKNGLGIGGFTYETLQHMGVIAN